MKLLKWSWLGVFALVFLVIACQKDAASPSETSAAKGGKTNVYDALTLTCAGNTLTSISLKVEAGNSGAPSGFTVQWMTKAQFDVAGWPTAEPDPITQSSFCKGSFSGNANASRYNLGSGDDVTIVFGSFLFDNGASTNCPDDLDCGTQYVFRAFAHGDNSKNRSAWSANETCATEDCDPTCTKFGFGYWKKDCELKITSSLTIGNPGIEYTPAQLCTILNTPAQGNGLLILGHQVIAAKLNGLNTETADNAIGTSNLLTDSQPANWQAQLIASLRVGNESCTQ
jgi:hypothetical protein